jgi:hypothetical protein
VCQGILLYDWDRRMSYTRRGVVQTIPVGFVRAIILRKYYGIWDGKSSCTRGVVQTIPVGL